MVRLNFAQRNECINWHAAWLNREKAYSEADRSSNARKEKAKEKKNQKKKKKKKKRCALNVSERSRTHTYANQGAALIII